jgi:hypothetical protein
VGDLAKPSADFQGAQESEVPVKNGSTPELPEGGQSTQAGALAGGAVAAPPKDPTEAAREDNVTPPPALDWLPDVPPPDAAPPVDSLTGEPPALVVLLVERAAPAGLAKPFGATVDAEEPAPRMTTPLVVIPPGVVTVCATAGEATAKAASNMWQSRCVMPREIARPNLVQFAPAGPTSHAPARISRGR